jgi:hypothetical protein
MREDVISGCHEEAVEIGEGKTGRCGDIHERSVCAKRHFVKGTHETFYLSKILEYILTNRIIFSIIILNSLMLNHIDENDYANPL